MICTVLILFFITIPEFALSNKLEISTVAKIKKPGTIGVSVFELNDLIYIFTIHREYIQLHYLDDDEIKGAEKFSLLTLPEVVIKTRRPVAGMHLTNNGKPILWLRSNLLTAGAFYNLQPLHPFISMDAYQPVSSGIIDSETVLLLSRFIPGTDILDGEIKIFSLQQKIIISNAEIEPFYLISHIEADPGVQTPSPWRWIVLLSDGSIRLYDKSLSKKARLPIKTGYFALIYHEDECVLITTSFEPLSANMTDSLIFHEIILLEKPVIKELCKMQTDYPIHAMDTVSTEDQLLLITLCGTNSEIIEIHELEF